MTVSVADTVLLLYEAVTDAVVFVATAMVFTVMVALVSPAGMENPAPTEAGLLADTATGRPPVGAGPLIVTVAVEELPPTTLVGLRLTDVTVAAVTVRSLEMPCPPYPALKETVASAATGMVVIGTDTSCRPAGTVTLAAMVAAAVLLLPRLSVRPPVGAGPLI